MSTNVFNQVTVKVKKNPPWLSSVLLTNIRKKNSHCTDEHASQEGLRMLVIIKKQRNLVADGCMLKASKAKFFDRLVLLESKSWKTVKTLSQTEHFYSCFKRQVWACGF